MKYMEEYTRWLELVDKKPFYMITTKELMKLLSLIQKLDSKKVCFSRNEIYDEFDGNDEIEEVINLLIDLGALSGVQGSTKELVVDDYDTFFKMLKEPQKYAME